MQEELISLSKGYSVLPNTISANKQLSWKAKGLLAFILNPPPTWSFSVKGLAGMATEGESAVRSALLEMEKSGYLLRERVRDSNGRFFKMRYKVSDRPIFLKQQPVSDLPLCENHKVANISITNKNITSGVINNINNKHTRTRESKASIKTDYTHSTEFYKLLDFSELNQKTANFIKQHPSVKANLNFSDKIDIEILKTKISESANVLQKVVTTSWFEKWYDKIIIDAYKDFYNVSTLTPKKVKDESNSRRAAKVEYSKEELQQLFSNIEEVEL